MPRKSDYHFVVDGESYIVYLSHNNFERCCDCGLVHRVKYQVIDRKNNPVKGARLRVTVWRAERNTAAVRRAFKFTKEEE